MPKKRPLPSTGPLADVKVGDRLIAMRREPEIAIVTKRTDKRVYVERSLSWYDLDGRGEGWREIFLRLPEPGELDRIRAANRAAAEKRRSKELAEAAKKATPEWQAADYIYGIGCYESCADSVMDKFDHAALIQAASIMRAGERK